MRSDNAAGAPERTPLESIAFAAWVNCPPNAVPPEYRQHTCEATMTAWRRVVSALFSPAALAASPEVQKLILKLERIADEIDEQVAVTRAYVADSYMDHNQSELMKICTSHFLDKARAIRAEAAAIREEPK